MQDRSSTGRILEVAQLYETTVVDNVSNLSAHFVVVPTRSMAEGSYFSPTPPLEALGLVPLADVPLGGVVRSLAACLRAEDVEEFLQPFDAGFEETLTQRIIHPPEYLAFAEYLTFARVVPFEGLKNPLSPPTPSGTFLRPSFTVWHNSWTMRMRSTLPCYSWRFRRG
jgi:hypothetical protein